MSEHRRKDDAEGARPAGGQAETQEGSAPEQPPPDTDPGTIHPDRGSNPPPPPPPASGGE